MDEVKNKGENSNKKNKISNISQESLEEVKYYLILAKDLKYLINEDLRLQLSKVEKILAGYIKSIKQNS